MDGRGGCCIARYDAAAGGGGSYQMSKIDRIMLRFRPIAPKPGQAGPAFVAGGNNDRDHQTYLKAGRSRRRGGSSKDIISNGGSNGTACNKMRCVNSGGGGRKRKSSSPTEEEIIRAGKDKSSSHDVARSRDYAVAVTLPLLPETPDLMAKTERLDWRRLPVGLSFSGCDGKNGVNISESCYPYPAVMGRVDGLILRLGGAVTLQGEEMVVGVEKKSSVEAQPRQRAVVGSWVIVDCVTDTWGTEGEDDHQMRITIGRTDEEKRRNLEEDTCPGFISDGWKRVWWTNKAYKEMVAGTRGSERGRKGGTTDGNDKEEEEKVVVWMVAGEKVPATCEGFTCRVRVQQPSTCHHRSGYCRDSCPTMPCDVWRMESGGFAWRLDVKAALSLKPLIS